MADTEQLKVLYIEDDVVASKLVSKTLERVNIKLEVARDGEQGLHLICTSQYDLFIVDMMLPVISGIELVKKIRELHKNTPVIMLTAVGVPEKVREAVQSGVDGYLLKPIVPTKLLAKMGELLKREDWKR